MGEQRQRHQAAHPQRRHGGQGLQECRHRLRCQSVFAGLARGIDLDKDIQRASFGLQTAVQSLGQAQAVQGLELAGKARHQLGLVGLQMADDRPAQIGEVLQSLPFAPGFLHLVFAQHAATRRMGQAQSVCGLGLAHRQQPHAARIPPGALAGSGHAGLHRRQVVLKIRQGQRLGVATMLVMPGAGRERRNGIGWHMFRPCGQKKTPARQHHADAGACGHAARHGPAGQSVSPRTRPQRPATGCWPQRPER